MGTAERRNAILRFLCRRRYETIPNLAAEFGVSTRTIQRDIEILSITEPIYTQCGRYAGGVYVTENYIMNNMYMSDAEISVLEKLKSSVLEKIVCDLSAGELVVLGEIITQYTKPKIRKEKHK